MIAVDTNLLVYAHRLDSEWNSSAHHILVELFAGRARWGIPWPCIHEFFAIATHARIYEPPSTPEQALDQIDAWVASPTIELLGETADHWNILRELLRDSRVQGPRIHDARIAAICLGHGVTELLTADRDFNRFPRLRVRNPLV